MPPIKTLNIRTFAREELRDITHLVQGVVDDSGIADGLCMVYVPHTTAGVTINENADPDVVRDIIETLDKLVPRGLSYHHTEGNAPAHVKAVLTGNSISVPVQNGRLGLGTWQGIFFCEFDGPRNRKVVVQVLRNT